MSDQFYIPQDVAESYHETGWLLEDLDEYTADEIIEWRAELRRVVRIWKSGGKEPCWQDYREWMNEISKENGYPCLFPPAPDDMH